MSTRHYKKQRKASKEVCARYQNLSKEDKNKKRMVIKDIEAFLKKKNRKSVIMLENDTEIF